MGFFDKRYTKVDHDLMENGAEIDFGDGFFVTVRHVSSKAVETCRGKKLHEMKVMGRNRNLTAEQNKALMHHTVANAGIVNWRGGDAPTFTPELAEQIFDDQPEFLEDVMTAMTTYEAFRQEEVDGSAGNSSTSSSGDSGSVNTSRPSKSTKPSE